MNPDRPRRVSVVLPELGVENVPIRAGQWLVDRESEIAEGDRLLEIVAGGATLDLPSPASGILRKRFVSDDDPLVVGQVLGVIEVQSDEELPDAAPPDKSP